MTSRNYAAIDLGSNSCRLLICDDNGKTLFTEHYSTRLAEGMKEDNCLTKQAIMRGEDAFYKIKQHLREYNVTGHNLRAIATAACRQAKNGAEFINKIKDLSGIELEIIAGEEEARLNLEGAIEHVRGMSKYVLLWDVGGGSTEVSLATNNDKPKIIKTISIPYGARNAAEQFDLHEYDEVKAAKLAEEIDGYLQKFLAEVEMPDLKDISFVATSSTALRLTAMIEGKDKYDREAEDGQVITAKQVFNILQKLYKCSVADLEKNPNVGESRAPIFVAACVIFAQIIRLLKVDNMTVSLKSAKDAIIANLIERDKKHG